MSAAINKGEKFAFSWLQYDNINIKVWGIYT